MIDRLSFGFHNPNHAAALVCALLPLCFGWRRAAWAGRGLAAGLFAALLLTQSRTGLLVAALEGAAWWAMRRGDGGFHISDLRDRMGFRGQRAVFSGRLFSWLGKAAVAALAVGLSLWWLGPRLALDGSILNRPKIWLAGLRLFAANPDGVGLGNSGALASAFLLPGDVPGVRTLVSSHLTLLAEGGWLVGWAHFAFLALALCGVRRSPRVGLAFAGLVLSACASTVFDWPVLFGFAAQGGLGAANWILSWLTLALFVVFGVRLVMSAFLTTENTETPFGDTEWAGETRLSGFPSLRSPGFEGRMGEASPDTRVIPSPEMGEPGVERPEGLVSPTASVSANAASACSVVREKRRKMASAVLFAGALVLAARCVPAGDAPRVQGGYAASGAAPRALALYDGSWSLRAVRARAGADALLPVRPVTRFPRGLDLSSVRCVLLFGDCREWAYLVPKGISVTCMED